MAYIGAEPLPGQNREVDDISSSFNGSTTAFTLQVNGLNVSPETANNILVNIGGVIQNPGTDYTIAASTITFTTAPASGLSFFGLILGAGINTATVADDTIGASKLVDTAVTAGSYTTADITVDAQGRITAAASGSISNAEIANNAVTTAKIADSTGASDGVTTAKLATDAVTAAKLASNSVVSDSIVDGSIVNADINASAAIAASKIADFVTGNTNNRVLTATGTANSLNGEANVVIDSSGRLGIGTTSPTRNMELVDSSSSVQFSIVSANNQNVFLNLGDTDDDNIGGINYDNTNNRLRLRANTTDAVQVKSNGDMSIDDGNLVIGTAGHGIDFSAQTATSASGATTSSELLDHYEEGTFTPFNPSLTATDLQGHYTRVGRVVHCSIFITIPSNSNGNAFVIDGLPFNTFNPDPSVGASLQGGYVIYSNYSAAVLVRTNQGGDRIVVNSIGGNNILLTNLDNISFRIGLHYFTT